MLSHRLHFGIALLSIVAIAVGSCSSPPKRLNTSERRSCIAQGGYESRGPFGSPFCQFRYPDGGKVCSGKSDCEGKCLLSVDGPPGSDPRPEEPARGLCEAERSTFGCYAVVEGGKVSPEGAICVD